jgi:hypothetical protein
VAAPDWHPDPWHRHELRYWDGNAWTAHVADRGQTSLDPIGVPPSGFAPIRGARIGVDPIGVAPLGIPPLGTAPVGSAGGRVDANTEIVGVYGHPSVDYDHPADVGQHRCRWSDVPGRERAVWESVLVEGEVPRICSWAGLLATDRALLVAEKWPAWHHVVGYTKFGHGADRYELDAMSDVDESGFTYAGTRTELQWKRDDKANGSTDGFLWALLEQRPELAPRLLVQPAELGESANLRAVKVGHLLSAEARGVDPGPGGRTSVESQYAVGTVGVVARRDPSVANGAYHQFVACPVCATQLRLRVDGEKVVICNPGLHAVSGGPYAVAPAPAHVIDES